MSILPFNIVPFVLIALFIAFRIVELRKKRESSRSSQEFSEIAQGKKGKKGKSGKKREKPEKKVKKAETGEKAERNPVLAEAEPVILSKKTQPPLTEQKEEKSAGLRELKKPLNLREKFIWAEILGTPKGLR
ncbi:MAG: hypothetical protein LBG87_07550 [Spirochaetaceae bacterium]|jgi:hypothetical protein|nr:hypothetical protein [Spirochaetaceae bacterium]